MNEVCSLPKRSPQLDLLRTIAILLVFFCHYNIFAGEEWFRAIGQFGWIGVDLFFTLSGFLIASQLLKEWVSNGEISLKAFYLRRGLRIWPSYIFVLGLYFAMPSFLERSTLPPLWKFLTFTQNFGLDFHTHGAFSHAWSLCVEEQFYLAFPVALILLARFSSPRNSLSIVVRSLVGVIAGGLALRYVLWNHYVAPIYNSPTQQGVSVLFFRELYYPTYCRLDGLALGVAIAALYRLRPELWTKFCAHANIFFAMGFLTMGLALVFVYHKVSLLSATLGFSLINVSFACFLIAALSPGGIFSKIRIPASRFGANLAFAFYLTHKQMIHLTSEWLNHAGIVPTSVVFPLVIFIVCLVAAIALYGLIEKPFLALRDHLIVVP